MLRRFVYMVAAALPSCASAENYKDFYFERGTTLPRAVSSDPMGVPYGSGWHPGNTADGSTMNMPHEARRTIERREHAELDARRAADEARRNPPFKLNIPPPERPKPVTADRSATGFDSTTR